MISQSNDVTDRQYDFSWSLHFNFLRSFYAQVPCLEDSASKSMMV